MNNLLKIAKEKQKERKEKTAPLVKEDEKTSSPEDEAQFQNVDNYFKKYRRNLAIRIVTGFALLFFLILELVFHKTIYEGFEKNLIVKIQAMFGTNKPEGNFILSFLAQLFQPYWVFIIVTHFMFTIYYGVNAILGAKIILSSLLVFSGAKILNLLHKEPRPYWMSTDTEKIVGWGCNPTFANPDLSLLAVIFFCGYTSHCFRKRNQGKKGSFFSNHFYSILGTTAVIGIIAVKVISGELFFTQIIVFAVYAGFFQYLIRFFDEPIDKIIERSTFRAHLENKYILNYFLIVLVILVVEIMLFVDDDTETYKHMTYLHNYLKCKRDFSKGQDKEPVYLNEAVGWYPTFHEGVYLVAMMASVLGISYAFRNVQKESFWFKPTKKEKTYRVVVVNAWTCFGWVAGFFRMKNQSFLDRIGIRAFYGNCIILFILYFVALGLLPRYLFARLHDEKSAIEEDQQRLKLKEKNERNESA